MKARICDRCGKVYPVSDRERREENKGYMHIVCNEDLGIGQPTYQYEKATDVDFCPECTESFLEWVRNPSGADKR